jgi:hypothetical protein
LTILYELREHRQILERTMEDIAMTIKVRVFLKKPNQPFADGRQGAEHQGLCSRTRRRAGNFFFGHRRSDRPESKVRFPPHVTWHSLTIAKNDGRPSQPVAAVDRSVGNAAAIRSAWSTGTHGTRQRFVCLFLHDLGVRLTNAKAVACVLTDGSAATHLSTDEIATALTTGQQRLSDAERIDLLEGSVFLRDNTAFAHGIQKRAQLRDALAGVAERRVFRRSRDSLEIKDVETDRRGVPHEHGTHETRLKSVPSPTDTRVQKIQKPIFRLHTPLPNNPEIDARRCVGRRRSRVVV